MSRMQAYVHTVYPTLVVKKLGSEFRLQPHHYLSAGRKASCSVPQFPHLQMEVKPIAVPDFMVLLLRFEEITLLRT